MIKELTMEKTSLPDGWSIKVLSDFTETINGLWTGKKEPYIPVKVYTMSNFTKGCDLNHSKKAREVIASVSQYEKRKLKYGDIIIEKSGGGPNQPVGRAVLFNIKNNEENTFSNFTTRLRICEKNKIDVNSNYLHKFLKLQYLTGVTEKFQKNSTNIRNLQLKEYLQLEIPLPPLPQQKQIVATLDNAFAAIDTAKANAIQNLQNAKELFESYLQNVFEKIKANGQLYSLANYLDLITYGFTNPMPTTDEGPYKVTAKDVKYGIVNYKTARRTSQDAFDNLIRDKCKPKKGDVLLTKDGTLGRLAVVEKANMCINQSVALLRPTKELDSYYLKELLSSKFYQELMIEQAGGATIKHIYITRVDKMLVPVPSITEQLAIIKKLDALSSETKKLETIYTKKIADLEEMKKSVLQKAFSGQLNTIN